jgi:uncharacterized protein (UPF0335 family)
MTGRMDPATRDRFRGFVERVERLAEEKDALGDDLKEVFAEAKAAGFDTSTMRKVIKARKVEAHEREEQIALFDFYMDALDMRLAEPLVSAALERAMKKAAEKPKTAARRKGDRERGDGSIQ